MNTEQIDGFLVVDPDYVNGSTPEPINPDEIPLFDETCPVDTTSRQEDNGSPIWRDQAYDSSWSN